MAWLKNSDDVKMTVQMISNNEVNLDKQEKHRGRNYRNL